MELDKQWETVSGGKRSRVLCRRSSGNWCRWAMGTSVAGGTVGTGVGGAVGSSGGGPVVLVKEVQ